MSILGGGDVLAGATGAGFNEAIQGELSKPFDLIRRALSSLKPYRVKRRNLTVECKK